VVALAGGTRGREVKEGRSSPLYGHGRKPRKAKGSGGSSYVCVHNRKVDVRIGSDQIGSCRKQTSKTTFSCLLLSQMFTRPASCAN
jgi:hypothetical protein